jgi:hypothetical protein
MRESFPDELGGLYDQTEINTIPDELPDNVIEVKAEHKPADEPKKEAQNPAPEPDKKKSTRKTEVVEAEVIKDEPLPEAEHMNAEGDEVMPPEPDDEPTEEAPEIPLSTDAQRKMIFAVSKKKGVTEDSLREKIQSSYGTAHTSELTKKQATELIESLLNLPEFK